MTEGLAGWPVRLHLPVQWGEMDALRHVNNAVYLRWVESARMEYFLRCGILARVETHDIGPILATTTIDFKAPVSHPGVVVAEATVTRLGNTSLTMGYRIRKESPAGPLAAEATGVVVLVEYGTGRKVALDDAIREGIRALETGDVVDIGP